MCYMPGKRSYEYWKAEFEEQQYTDEWERVWRIVIEKSDNLKNPSGIYEKTMCDYVRAGVEEELTMRLGSSQINILIQKCRREIDTAYKEMHRYDRVVNRFGRSILAILYEVEAFFHESSGTRHQDNMQHQGDQIHSRPQVLAYIQTILLNVHSELHRWPNKQSEIFLRAKPGYFQPESAYKKDLGAE